MNQPGLRSVKVKAGLLLCGLAASLCLVSMGAQAADWPQWRGANRDGKAAGFEAPKAWPKELAQKWKVTVGPGDATPALVGDKLYVFARDATSELMLCLDSATGKEIWRDKYDAQPPEGPSSRHPGPRSSPTVSGGKVVAYGVRGQLSCLDAATGKVVWRKDDFPGAWPRFFTASSPLVVDNLCIAQLGGEGKGGIIAYDLASGEQKWKWAEDGTGYASPTLLTVGDAKMLVTLTASKIVGIGIADGKLLWSAPFAPQGMSYNTDTPMVEGQTVIYSGAGRGTKALKIEKTDTGFAAKDLWSNPENAVQFNNPVLKGGQVYGISQMGNLFCLDAQSGKTLWTAPLGAAPAGGGGGGMGGGMRGRGGRGFGTLVDAGPVLMALTQEGDLVVFEPSDKELKKLATYKVGTEVYAYPVVAGNKVYIKDKDSLALLAIE